MKMDEMVFRHQKAIEKLLKRIENYKAYQGLDDSWYEAMEIVEDDIYCCLREQDLINVTITIQAGRNI